MEGPLNGVTGQEKRWSGVGVIRELRRKCFGSIFTIKVGLRLKRRELEQTKQGSDRD